MFLIPKHFTLFSGPRAKLEKMKKRNQGDEKMANEFPLYVSPTRL